METNNGIEVAEIVTRQEWRQWLAENGLSKKVVCVIIHNKKSKSPGMSYADAVEEALCYGWIDSRANKRDEASFYLRFTPRKPKSNWSKPNVERAGRMAAAGLMTEHGQKFIDIAKQNGKWPE